jgi:hypothetical protein
MGNDGVMGSQRVKAGSLGNPSGRFSPIMEKSPVGTLSLRQRQANATKQPVTVMLDNDAYVVLSAAAAHRSKVVERLAADVLEGVSLTGGIDTFEAKATAYRLNRGKRREKFGGWMNLDEFKKKNGI